MAVISVCGPANEAAFFPTNIVKGGFNWGLHFKWENMYANQLSKMKDYVRPIR